MLVSGGVAPDSEPVQSTSDTNDSADSNEESANQWSNQCEYQCLECGKIQYSHIDQRSHIQDEHGMNVTSYKEKHRFNGYEIDTKLFMTKEVRFNCHIHAVNFIRDGL